ncbi:MAG: tetratricopeptide repeat protein [Myxococcaceae bacterium]|nr:tetratricopeptide repeat protein [Myxococcaceae bacterium]
MDTSKKCSPLFERAVPVLKPVRGTVAVLALLGAVACAPKEDVPLADPQTHVDGLYLAATEAYLAGKYDEAEAKFDRVAALSPTDARLPAARGELYLAQGKPLQAKAAFQAAVKVEPSRAANHTRLGAVLYRLGDLLGAVASLDKALALNPQDYSALDLLSRIEAQRANTVRAVELMQRALVVAPKDIKPDLAIDASRMWVKAGREADGIKMLEEARARQDVSDKLLAELANQLVNARRYDDALAVYRDLSLLRPKNMATWQMIGELELKAGRLLQADEALRMALALKENAALHAALARVCYRQKNNACVQNEMKAAIDKLTDEEPLALLQVAQAFAEVGHPADGLKLLTPLFESNALKNDVSLLQRAAAMAKEAKDFAAVQRLCARVEKIDAKMRCP